MMTRCPRCRSRAVALWGDTEPSCLLCGWRPTAAHRQPDHERERPPVHRTRRTRQDA